MSEMTRPQLLDYLFEQIDVIAQTLQDYNADEEDDMFILVESVEATRAEIERLQGH